MFAKATASNPAVRADEFGLGLCLAHHLAFHDLIIQQALAVMQAVLQVEKSGELGIPLRSPACKVPLSRLDWNFKGNGQISDLYSDFDSALDPQDSDYHLAVLLLSGSATRA